MAIISHIAQISATPISRAVKTDLFSRLSKVTSFLRGVSSLGFPVFPYFLETQRVNHNEPGRMVPCFPFFHYSLRAVRHPLRFGSFSLSFSHVYPFIHETTRFGLSFRFFKRKAAKSAAADFLSCLSAASIIPVPMLRGSKTEPLKLGLIHLKEFLKTNKKESL